MRKDKKIIFVVIGLIVCSLYSLIQFLNLPECYCIDGKDSYIMKEVYPGGHSVRESAILLRDEETFNKYFNEHLEVMDLLENVITDDFWDTHTMIVMQGWGDCYVKKIEMDGNKATVVLKRRIIDNSIMGDTYFIPISTKNIISKISWKNEMSLIQKFEYNYLPMILFFGPLLVIVILNLKYEKLRNVLDDEELKKKKNQKLYISIAAVMFLILYILGLIR